MADYIAIANGGGLGGTPIGSASGAPPARDNFFSCFSLHSSIFPKEKSRSAICQSLSFSFVVLVPLDIEEMFGVTHP